MGQFYRAVFLTETTQIRSWVDPQQYGQKPTLREHSHKDNKFITAIEMLLRDDKGLYGPTRLVWAGDYAFEEPGSTTNLYKSCEPAAELFPEESDVSAYGFLVNHTKRQFVSKERAEKYTDLHPLPLLTAESSSFASDYPRDHAAIGCWARDEISVSRRRPDGYVEIIFDLA
jgi:hypothetical protein